MLKGLRLTQTKLKPLSPCPSLRILKEWDTLWGWWTMSASFPLESPVSQSLWETWWKMTTPGHTVKDSIWGSKERTQISSSLRAVQSKTETYVSRCIIIWPWRSANAVTARWRIQKSDVHIQESDTRWNLICTDWERGPRRDMGMWGTECISPWIGLHCAYRPQATDLLARLSTTWWFTSKKTQIQDEDDVPGKQKVVVDALSSALLGPESTMENEPLERECEVYIDHIMEYIPATKMKLDQIRSVRLMAQESSPREFPAVLFIQNRHTRSRWDHAKRRTNPYSSTHAQRGA